jgi:membrane fusion protein (multidrug efflux system)
VIQKDVPIYSEWVGTTVGYIDAQICPRVQGYIQSRPYKEGSFVQAGDLLFTIDPREYQTALDQALANLRQAEANLKKTQLDVARNTPLAKVGAVSRQELDNAVQANQANKASVAAAQAAVANAHLNVGWTHVTAPIAGIAGISEAQIGDLVMPTTVLTTVSQVDPIKVQFPISEQEYWRFAQRIRAREEERASDGPPFTLILANGSVYPEPGRFSAADREVDLRTGTIIIQALFPNPGNLLRPGQYAKIRAVTRLNKNALLVPQRAVEELQGSYQVAVVGPNNTVDLRPVEVGEKVGSLWIVDQGLQPGERVVVAGLQKVKDGVVVNAQPLPAEAAVAANTPTGGR